MSMSAQLFTLSDSDPIDCSLSMGFPRQERVAISFSRGYSQPRDQMQASSTSCIAGGFFHHLLPPWAIMELLDEHILV